MDPAAVDVDELVEFWTLLEIDREQLIGKRGCQCPSSSAQRPGRLVRIADEFGLLACLYSSARSGICSILPVAQACCCCLA